MAANIDALLRHGTVSTRAMNRQLEKTTSEPSRMADFDDRSPDEGARRRPSGPKGFRDRHINNERMQREASPIASAPTSRKGGKQRRGQPTREHIDREQGPKYPSEGAELRASEARRPIAPAVKRKPPPTGGLYGGGGRNTQ